MQITITLPKEFDAMEKGSKFLDIKITDDSTWRYKAHDLAVKAAQKAFEEMYTKLMQDPDALVEYARMVEWIEIDNAPQRQSVLVGEKVVLMNDLLKTSDIKVVDA